MSEGPNPTHPRSRPRTIAAAVLLCSIVLLWVTALATDLIDGVSATSGVFVASSVALSAALVVMSLLGRSSIWFRRRFAPMVVVVAVAVGAAAVAIRHSGIIVDAYPPSFLVWVAVGILSVVIVPIGWRHSSATARLVTVTAALVVPFTAFSIINAHYDYWPTLGTLTGGPLQDEVSASTASKLLASQITPSGTIPGAPTDGKGLLTSIDIPADASGFPHRSAMEYLPPAFFTAERSRLPVIVMLSGSPGAPTSWPRTGVVKTADAFAASHDGAAPVLLFPDENGSFTGDTECVDGPRGRAETYLTTDVADFVKSTLHMNPSPDQFAIVGFSAGGTCALDLTLRHTDEFHRFVSFGGDPSPHLTNPSDTLRNLFGGDRGAMASHDALQLMTHHRFTMIDAWFYVGDQDSHHVQLQTTIVEAAQGSGAVVSSGTLPGAHTMSVAQTGFSDLLPDLWKALDGPG